MKIVILKLVLLASIVGFSKENKLLFDKYSHIKMTLVNKMEVVLIQNQEAPEVSIIYWIKSGSFNEEKLKSGAASITVNLLKNYQNSDKSKVSDILKSVNSEESFNLQFNSMLIKATVQPEILLKTIELQMNRFQNFNFSEEELSNAKEIVKTNLLNTFDQNISFHFWENIYRFGFNSLKYSNFIFGKRNEIDNVNKQDVYNYYNKNICPNKIGLFISGNINLEEIKNKLNYNWNKNCIIKKTATDDSDFVKKPGVYQTNFKSNSKNFMLGIYLPEINSDNYLTLDFIKYIVIGSENSLVKRLLKDKKKLVSSIESFNYDQDQGLFKIIGTIYPKIKYFEFINEMKFIADYYKEITEIEHKTYIEEFAANFKDNLLKNSSLNYNISKFWGKYDAIADVYNFENQIRTINKKYIYINMKHLLNPNNIVLIHGIERVK